MTRILAAMLALITLTACGAGRDEPDLLVLNPDAAGPDEFSIVPNRPLELPPSFSELPVPTPGGINRTDQTPLADAARALGGSGAVPRGGVPASDAALIAAAGAPQAGIRGTLASEDLAFRRGNDARPLERLFGVNVYGRAYAAQRLDPRTELDRLRALGVRTPSPPPPPRD
ncbi:beta-barrel assembly complex subunit BamF [Hasllibacter halocynthiae]|uniref:Beta-barrel assembly complex subunit BamF n=1 Tax=Hasllibacter halocynthiae TaxID=595589 RepID=A0A2T0X3N9_9RHOB|nr:DUF3035 domain-containing protein [Hasllibacter halocynthiae]PRY93562.1 beta-barrel assembly complex subunit BamF [Hasllibacter halocynthiae]